MIKEEILETIETPIYICEEKKLEENAKIFDSIQKKTNCKIILALKAFSMHSTFHILRPYLSGVTASSLNEAKLGKEEFKKEVHTYSPAYKDSEIKELANYSDHITFNSINQLKSFKEKFIKNRNKKKEPLSFGLRLNPEHSEVNIKIYDPCQKHSRFGITKIELDEKIIEQVDGLHFHSLCGHNVDAFERTFNVIESKFKHLFSTLKWLNLGGGHGITKSNYDIDKLCKLITEIQTKYNVQVILEPGEAIALNAGVLVTTVIDIIKNEMDIAILDASATAHMPDILEMPYRADIKKAGMPNEKQHTYRLGGPTCLSGDIIGDYSFDTPLNIGEKLIFEDMAHYTMVKNTSFNGIQLPSISRITKKNELIINAKFNYTDFKRRV